MFLRSTVSQPYMCIQEVKYILSMVSVLHTKLATQEIVLLTTKSQVFSMF